MILKEYNIGWGLNWTMKQLEQQIVNARLSKYYTDDSRTVIINSVWYTQDYHQQVIAELRNLQPTHIFVVAMLDPPIIDLEWFDEFNCNVQGIGYYPGNGYVDYFAIFADKFFQPVDQVLLDASKIDRAYMCLNRKPHSHRLRLYQGLESAGILDQGIVSMGGDPPIRLLVDDVDVQQLAHDVDVHQLAPNGGIDQFGIGNDIISLGNIGNWQRHFVNIVTETIWDIDSCNFLSEKTFKPILGLRPFLIYAPDGGVMCLTRRGFEPYVDDFKDISDVDLRHPYNIPVFLTELCKQGPDYWKMKLLDLKEKLLYNQQQFKEHVRKQS